MKWSLLENELDIELREKKERPPQESDLEEAYKELCIRS